MDRRRFLVTSLAGALVVPLTAGAQLSKPIVRIGFLSSSSAERERPRLTAFQQTLRELEYLEGQNIVIVPRYAGGNFQQLPSLAAELAHVNLDILVAAGAPASLAARKTTSVIPIVMVGVADPVGVGLVDSLARPGGNITGLSDFNAGVVAKRLELLREVVPSASRVVVLGNPTNPSNPLQVKLTEAAAAPLGVRLLLFEAKSVEEIDRAFAAMRAARAEAVIVIGDPMFGTHRRRLIDLSATRGLPAIYSTREYVIDGGFVSYGTNLDDLYRRAPYFVDQILKGAKPAHLPIEQPTKFELVINLKTAKTLGLTIPPSLLARADHVIE
jgi:putative tryptophan/tyrosine transport system substrate-binding protein